MKIINDNIKVTQVIEEPYLVWVFDNFLSEDVYTSVLSNWPKDEDVKWHGVRGNIENEVNILEQGMMSYDIKDTDGFMSKFLHHLHSEEFTQELSQLTNMDGLVPDKHMRWSGIRTMLSGGFQAVHSDARVSPDSGLRKELTCLIYFNEDWSADDTGTFEIWNDDMTECTHKIDPIANRLVVFLNSETSYHGVPDVKKERRSVTWSVLKDGESSERSKALFVSRPQDGDEISELGKKRAQVTDVHK